MIRKSTAALIGLAILGGTTTAQAAIIGAVGNTSAPLGTLGGYTMTPFANDPRPTNPTTVSSVPSPLGGDLMFSPDLTHDKIGDGWATWSHGYTGDVYDTYNLYDPTTVTLTLPDDTVAFYFYAEPNAAGLHQITFSVDGAPQGGKNVEGISGANYFGAYTTNGDLIHEITVTCSGCAFAVGEFGIAKAETVDAVPEPASLLLFGSSLAGLTFFRRRKQQAA